MKMVPVIIGEFTNQNHKTSVMGKIKNNDWKPKYPDGFKGDGRKLNGGARANAGRKKSDDPKQKIDFWIETSIVEKNGGKVECQEKCKELLREKV